MYKFYDTSSLLLEDDLFSSNEPFGISSITLEELENIKTSYHKDQQVKSAARRVLRSLDEHAGAYDIIIFEDKFLKKIKFPETNDIKILACALATLKTHEDLVFVTNDLALKAIARMYLPKSSLAAVTPKAADDYCGFKDIVMSDEEMAEFYQYLDNNKYNLLPNEYIVIRNKNNEIVDKMCWTGEKHRPLIYSTFSSYWFGDIKPYKDDPYQACAMDSMVQNQITMVSGRAGSGKTFLSLAYLFSLLAKGKIDRIVIFCNPVVAKDAAKLGLA